MDGLNNADVVVIRGEDPNNLQVLVHHLDDIVDVNWMRSVSSKVQCTDTDRLALP